MFIIRQLLYEIMGRKVSLESYVDIRKLFNVVAKDCATTGRRLQIDIFGLRESY